MAKPEQKAEAVRLRTEERLSLEAISQRLGVSQSSCSYWLRGLPLTKEEIGERNRRHNKPSPLPPFVNSCTQNTDGKGTIAASVWEGKTTVCLRYIATRNNQKQKCLNATEYEY